MLFFSCGCLQGMAFSELQAPDDSSYLWQSLSSPKECSFKSFSPFSPTMHHYPQPTCCPLPLLAHQVHAVLGSSVDGSVLTCWPQHCVDSRYKTMVFAFAGLSLFLCWLHNCMKYQVNRRKEGDKTLLPTLTKNLGSRPTD